MAIFTAFASVAHEGILIRDLVRREATAGSILGAGFLLRAAGALSGVVLALLFALWVPDARAQAGLIALLSLGLLLQPADVIDYWFQSRLEARYAVLIRVSVATGVGLLKVVLAYRQVTLPCSPR